MEKYNGEILSLNPYIQCLAIIYIKYLVPLSCLIQALKLYHVVVLIPSALHMQIE